MSLHSHRDSSRLDWEGLATIFIGLPEKDKEKCIDMMLLHIHDLRQSISVIYASEALLRRMVTDDNLENPIELLNAMQIAYQRMFTIVEDMSNTFDEFDE
jgi:hypothetical protein